MSVSVEDFRNGAEALHTSCVPDLQLHSSALDIHRQASELNTNGAVVVRVKAIVS